MRTVWKETPVTACSGDGRREGGGEGEDGLNVDIKPGQQPDAPGQSVSI
ncbi:hypothetical protein [Klebsiella oxytoca]